MQIKIIEPIKEYSKVFNSPDEFNLWYTKNKDEMDNMTTHKLNKLYKIEGYRITKIKNVLMLKKIVKLVIQKALARDKVLQFLQLLLLKN